jgi:membrane-associated phospholipid phosphatase
MKKLTTLSIALLSFLFSTAQQAESPYEWDWTTDGIWTGVGLAGSATGLYLIINKEGLTMEEFEALDENDINSFDRWAAGNHSETANTLSDAPFAFSFGAPFLLLFDDEINEHAGQVGLLYLETLATTATMYTLTAALVDRSRPYVYDTSGETPLNRRLGNNGQRSFYAGHVAASAAATFFAAKVYSDFNPDSTGKFWVWAGAAAIPASVSYFRIEAGQHFLSDVIVGYIIGATTGILVPELHKKKRDNIDVYPKAGRTDLGGDYRGMAIRVTF